MWPFDAISERDTDHCGRSPSGARSSNPTADNDESATTSPCEHGTPSTADNCGCHTHWLLATFR